MISSSPQNKPKSPKFSWQKIIKKYENPHLWRSIWQLTNTLVPYFALLYLMYRSLFISYWVTVLLSVLAAGFLVRIFIIFHDCGHGSFFKSQLANDLCGFITGVLVFTPYYHWWHSHARHHATSGDLDRRGIGDVWTMTVEEYLKSPFWKRFGYRFSRHPVGLLVLGPTYYFLIRNRFYPPRAGHRERLSVHMTNLAIVTVAAWVGLWIGFKEYLLIQLPVIVVSATAGVWLFYVQHQFDGAYWERHGKWDYVDQAIKGSSFYKLPKILQWFTGNIGFHHIHHLSPRIPNYYLEKVHRASTIFKKVKPITLLVSLRSLRFRLWDEKGQKLVSFRFLKSLRKKKQEPSKKFTE